MKDFLVMLCFGVVGALMGTALGRAFLWDRRVGKGALVLIAIWIAMCFYDAYREPVDGIEEQV